MAKDIIQLAGTHSFDSVDTTNLAIHYNNVVTVQVNDKELALSARPRLRDQGTPSAATANSRGCFFYDNDSLSGSDRAGRTVGVTDSVAIYNNSNSTTTMSEAYTTARAYFLDMYDITLSGPTMAILNPSCYEEDGTNFVAGNQGSLYYRDSATTMAQVTLPADVYPAHGLAYLNGRAFILMQNGSIYQSDIDDITTWGATAFITAERSEDSGVFIATHRDHIVVFGKKTIEFFYDAGNAPNSTLQRRQDIFHNVGTLFPHSVRVLGDVIYFMGTSSTGSDIGVFKLENFQLSRISTPFIDKQVMDAYPSSNIQSQWVNYRGIGAAIRDVEGNTYITFDMDDNTFVFDTRYSMWYSWDNGDTDFFTIYGDNGTAEWDGGTLQLAGGQYATFNGATTPGDPDAGSTTAMRSRIYPPLWDKNTNERKKIKSVRLVHNSDNNGTASTAKEVTIAWREESGGDESSFTNGRTVDTNTPTARLYRCGITRQRMFRLDLDYTYGFTQKLKYLEIDYEQLRG